MLDENKAPKVLGRSEVGNPDPRSDTELAYRVTVPWGDTTGNPLEIRLFESTDSGDRGGYVLRISAGGEDFIPHAERRPSGVDLHVAGTIEGGAFLRALHYLLGAVLADHPDLIRRGSPNESGVMTVIVDRRLEPGIEPGPHPVLEHLKTRKGAGEGGDDPVIIDRMVR